MQQAEPAARKRALNQWLSVISKSKVFFLPGKRQNSGGPNLGGNRFAGSPQRAAALRASRLGGAPRNEPHREGPRPGGALRNRPKRTAPDSVQPKQLSDNPAQRKIWRKRGQGLIEYLILTALMGVAAIAIIRSLNQTVKSRFANVIYALQGKNQKAKTHTLKKEEYQRSDLSNFMSGAADRKKEKK